MEKIIQVGTKVTLSKESEWWNDDGMFNNPQGIAGVVIRNQLDGCKVHGWPYQVQWDNDESNSYNAVDLKVLGQGYNFGELYTNIHGDIYHLGRIGTYSKINLFECGPLYVGDLLEVRDLRTNECGIAPLVFDGTHFYIWGWGVRSRDGDWKNKLEVKLHSGFGGIPFCGSWTLGQVHWCKQFVEGLPSW
ncbi:hypothetical protein Bestia_00017 [Acinetobacter phage Bestia]|nr:hypothetical protein Bestia_00017 [Acinetobacter phage Bestia]